MGELHSHNITKDSIDLQKLPVHIAVIMDGNGRWAKSKGKHRIFGHKNGVKAVREITEGCAELGVSHLTLYAFSTENWNRPQTEVSALMDLLLITIGREVKTLMKNNIRLNAIGDTDSLPEKTRKELFKAIDTTKSNTRMTLTLALSYGSRAEIISAVKDIVAKVQQGELLSADIDESCLTSHLYTYDMPDPELLIRTSGEHRVSNFLLWQLAYTEFYFTDVFWPDFDKNELYKAIFAFQNRERRFGMTSEQIISA